MLSASTHLQASIGDAGAQPAIELIDVTKVYPRRRGTHGPVLPSVDRLNLTIGAGQVYALLGPNGAGKSTTVRMIATLLEPTSGQVRVCGLDSATHRRETRALLGVALGGERSVYWKLTARQNLEYFAALHGQSRRRARGRIEQVLELLDIADRADEHIETWSTGLRQRLVLARALLNRPRVLLLDEPSSGLDPRAAQGMQEHILRFREAGHTILLTTHDMAEADMLATRVGIIDSGRLAGEGTPAELKRAVGASRVVHAHVRVESPGQLERALRDLGETARTTVDGVVTEAGGTVVLTLMGSGGDELVPRLIGVAQRHQVDVLRVENESVSLKDVFLTLTGRRLNADADTP